ncbi:MAG: hypothetical protein Q8P20_06445 [bacterium]|nr:hypothetical protein [bacterium]
MMNKIAQIKLSPDGGYKGFGPLGLEQGQEGISVFATFLSSAVGLITIIGIIWMVFIIIIGSVAIISSGGDKQALEVARKKITNGIIGLVVLVSSLFILSFIGKLLGLPNILDIATLFGSLN